MRCCANGNGYAVSDFFEVERRSQIFYYLHKRANSPPSENYFDKNLDT